MVDVGLTCTNYFNVIHPIVLIIWKPIVSVKHNIYLLVLFHKYTLFSTDLNRTSNKQQQNYKSSVNHSLNTLYTLNMWSTDTTIRVDMSWLKIVTSR